MNEYTVANARNIYCEIKDRKEISQQRKKEAIYNAKLSRKIDDFFYEIDCVYYEKNNSHLYSQLADYPWYVRIWARLTYKI
jgi:hypothetical protein